MPRVHVVAAVIRNDEEHVLLAKRPLEKHQGGLWEFPGGKVEIGENPQQALVRELCEELDIQVEASRPLIQVRHDYPDKQVLLDVWEVVRFSGTPRGVEGQPLVWVRPRDLRDYAFPAANEPIVRAVQLPFQYLITPDELDRTALLQGVKRALDGGIRLLQLRSPTRFDPQYRDMAADVQGLCAGKALLMLKGPLEWLGDFPAAGWHLTAAQLRDYASAGRPFPRERWLGASCHNAEELVMATRMGVDFVTISPVQETQTHPDASPLGWETVARLLENFNQPAYLLGGVGPDDIDRARQIGAQGVAGIRAFWPS